MRVTSVFTISNASSLRERSLIKFFYNRFRYGKYWYRNNRVYTVTDVNLKWKLSRQLVLSRAKFKRELLTFNPHEAE